MWWSQIFLIWVWCSHFLPPGSLYVPGASGYLSQSLINLYIMACMRISFWTNWWIYNSRYASFVIEGLLWFYHRILLFLYLWILYMHPHSSGNMQKHEYLRHFQGIGQYKNISGNHHIGIQRNNRYVLRSFRLIRCLCYWYTVAVPPICTRRSCIPLPRKCYCCILCVAGMLI